MSPQRPATLAICFILTLFILTLIAVACISAPTATGAVPVASPAKALTKATASPTPSGSALTTIFTAPTATRTPAPTPTFAPVPTPTIYVAGEIVYNEYCNDCHSRVDPIAGRNIKGTDPETVKKIVRTGEGAMPVFSPAQLSDDQLNAVATYVSSLPQY